MTDDTPRARPGTACVESWFFRLNHPTEPKALWVRATACTRETGGSTAEAWAAVFDGPRTHASRAPVPFETASFGADGARVAETEIRFPGVAIGEVGPISWDLTFTPDPRLGAPMRLLPDRLFAAPFPKNKVVSPVPAARFRGTVRWADTCWAVDDWVGMRGHNWGPHHAPEYAWGQAVFVDRDGAPCAVVEGATGRIRLGPARSPRLSLLGVRWVESTGVRTLRWDRVVDLWRQRARIDPPAWTLEMSGRAGTARLEATLDPARSVSLAYDDPDGARHICTNSKTAALSLTVAPTSGDVRVLRVDTAALELLSPSPVAGAPEVV